MSASHQLRTQLFILQEHASFTAYLAGIHAECIRADKMTGTFTSPIDTDSLLKWWKDRIAEAVAGTRVIIMLIDCSETIAEKQPVGVAMLSMPHIQTSPFRASVESLLVRIKYRRRGGGTALLQAVEEQAKLKAKTLLVKLSSFPG